jgi:UDP-N-acetyl-2-amino-2-deoxyglucuronate dehydrogenase
VIRFAIVGCGRIAHRHAEIIHNVGTLSAVCDIIPDRALQLAGRYGAKNYSSIDELLENEELIDVVVVASPNGLHCEHVIKSLRANKHVLCEKPMAINVHDCTQMIEEAERTGRHLLVVKQNRYNPPVQAVKSLLNEGRLGKILSIQLSCFWNRDEHYYQNSWKGSKQLDGGTLYTQFSHFIDLLYWMFGDVKKLKAYILNANHQNIIEFEDEGVVILEFSSGALGTINYTVNSYEKNMEGSLTIFGEKGTVKIGGQYLNELEYQRIKDYEIKDLRKSNPPNMYGTYVGSMSNHDKVYKNLVEVLSGDDVIATNGFEGLKTVEIIEKIYRSAEYAQAEL